MRRDLWFLDYCLPRPGLGEQLEAGVGARSRRANRLKRAPREELSIAGRAALAWGSGGVKASAAKRSNRAASNDAKPRTGRPLQTLPTIQALPRDGNQAKAKDDAQWLTEGHAGEGWDVGGEK